MPFRPEVFQHQSIREAPRHDADWRNFGREAVDERPLGARSAGGGFQRLRERPPVASIPFAFVAACLTIVATGCEVGSLRRPVVFVDESLGEFVLNSEVEMFEGLSQWNGETVRLVLRADGTSVDASALDTAHRLWSEQAKWSETIEAYLVDDLLEVKNEYWREETEPILSRDEFLSQTELRAVTIQPDGDFEFYFHAGDLFWGHAIIVDGSLQYGLRGAGLAG